MVGLYGDGILKLRPNLHGMKRRRRFAPAEKREYYGNNKIERDLWRTAMKLLVCHEGFACQAARDLSQGVFTSP